MTDTRTTPNDYKPLDLPPEARAAIKKALEPNDTSTPQKTYKKTLDLSPEARAAMARVGYLTATTYGTIWCEGGGYHFAEINCPGTGGRAVENEIAAFIAALVNEALTAAAPAALCEYDDCDQAALPGGEFCTVHQAEHDELMADADYDAWNNAKDSEHYESIYGGERDAEFRQAERDGWTAEQILQREG